MTDFCSFEYQFNGHNVKVTLDFEKEDFDWIDLKKHFITFLKSAGYNYLTVEQFNEADIGDEI